MFVANLTRRYALSDTTALLIFAQSVTSDAAHKRLADQPPVRQQILARLNRRVAQTAEATHLPILYSADLTPHRGTFGQQFTEAVRATFALGFEQVIVIGNDCPALTTTHLTQAANALNSVPVVLGPDRRGGLYLFGLTRTAFEQLSVTALPWQTNQLYRAVRQLCAKQPVACLPRLGDVNNRTDLRQYQATTPVVALFVAHLLRLGTGRLTLPGPAQVFRLANVPVGPGSLRAPPAFPPVAIAA